VGGFTASNLLRFQESSGTIDSVSPLNNAQYNALVALVNGTSSLYLPANSNGAILPSVSAAPSSPAAGTIWYNSSSGSVQFEGTAGVQTIGTSGGSVSSVAAGTGLTGGPITSTGTLSLATLGAGGTGTKITFDSYGRVTASTTLAASDIPSISAASLTGTLAVANGGTGQGSTLNQGGVIYASSTTAMGSTAAGTAGQVLTSTGTGAPTWAAPADSSQWTTSGSNIYNANAGYVGIGLSSPAALLHINGNNIAGYGTSAGGLILQANNPSWGVKLYEDTSSNFHMNVGGSERMNISNVGYVGIGVTSPAYPLSVNGTISATDIIAKGPLVDVRAYGADPTGAADSTAAVQAALTANPNGTIYFPAQTDGSASIYSISSITVLKTQRLLGVGATASQINCTSTTTACIVITDSNSNYVIGGIDNIYLYGPGTGNSSIGIFLGGDPAGVLGSSGNFADGETFHNIRVSNFNVGVKFGNNAWSDRFDGSTIIGNSTGIDFPGGLSNSGEAIGINDSVIANGTVGIEDDGGGEFLMTNSSLDYNGTAVSGTAVSGTNIILYASNCHFEQSSGNFVFSPSGGVSLVLNGITFLLESSNGTDTKMINIWPQYASVKIDGASIYSNHPVTYFFWINSGSDSTPVVDIKNISGNGNGEITNLTNTIANPAGVMSQAMGFGNGWTFGCDQGQADGQLTLCGQSAATPVGLSIQETSNAGSKRAALKIGSGWQLEQDFLATGTKTFGVQDLTANATRLAIDTSGEVGIGTTNPAYPLDVAGDIRTSTCLHYASSTLGTCSSDERLKKDIKPYDLGLKELVGLEPVTFKYNGLGGNPDDGKTQVGVIAQQVEKVAPQLVGSKELKLHPDDKNMTMTKTVDYGAFTYMIINSVKTLYSRLMDVDAKTAKLEAENDKLKQQNTAMKSWICTQDPKAALCK
jgi:hypothetical protein